MMTKTRKTAWTADRWLKFAQRCRRLRDRADAYAVGFPSTHGFRAQDLDALLKIRRQLEAALMAVENVILSQLGEQVADRVVPALFRQEKPATPKPVRTGNDRQAPILPRDRWVELGAELKAIDTELSLIIDEFQTAAGATLPFVNRFIRVHKAISKAKCGLDDLVCRQHPGWPQFARVFYGSLDPVL